MPLTEEALKSSKSATESIEETENNQNVEIEEDLEEMTNQQIEASKKIEENVLRRSTRERQKPVRYGINDNFGALVLNVMSDLENQQ